MDAKSSIILFYYCKFANMDSVSELTPGGASRVNLSICQLWIDVWESGVAVLQHMEITLDGLIWDMGVFNYGFDYV